MKVPPVSHLHTYLLKKSFPKHAILHEQNMFTLLKHDKHFYVRKTLSLLFRCLRNFYNKRVKFDVMEGIVSKKCS